MERQARRARATRSPATATARTTTTAARKTTASASPLQTDARQHADGARARRRPTGRRDPHRERDQRRRRAAPTAGRGRRHRAGPDADHRPIAAAHLPRHNDSTDGAPIGRCAGHRRCRHAGVFGRRHRARSTSAATTATDCSRWARCGCTSRPWTPRCQGRPAAQRGQVRGRSNAGNAVDDTDLVHYNGGGTPPARSASRRRSTPPTRPGRRRPRTPTAPPADPARRHADHLDLPGVQRRHRARCGSTRSSTTSAPRANAGDDFTPVAVLAAGFNVGDVDHDGLLDRGEVLALHLRGNGSGRLCGRRRASTLNVATVVGTGASTGSLVQDDDAAYYLGVSNADGPRCAS